VTCFSYHIVRSQRRGTSGL